MCFGVKWLIGGGVVGGVMTGTCSCGGLAAAAAAFGEDATFPSAQVACADMAALGRKWAFH